MHEIKKATTPSTKHWIWLVYCGLIFVVLLSLSIAQDFYFAGRSEAVSIVFGGVLVGALSIAAVWAACVGNTWLRGFSMVTGVICLGGLILTMCTHLCANFGVESRVLSDEMASNLLLPTVVLGLASPMLAMRQLFGWRIVPVGQDEVSRVSSSLEDLFSYGTLVACVAVITRFVQVLSVEAQKGSDWYILALGFVCVLWGLLAIVPMTWIGFRSRSWAQRIVGWTGWAFLIGLLIAAFGDWSDPEAFREMLFDFTMVALVVYVTTTVSLSVMILCRFQLSRYEPVGAGSQPQDISSVAERGPWDERTMEPAMGAPTVDLMDRSIRRESRVWTGVAVGCAIASVVTGLVLENRKSSSLFELSKLSKELESDDGSVKLDEDKIVHLQVGRSFTDNDFSQLQKYPDLQRLSLKHSQISDQGLKNLSSLPRLTYLDLSYTSVSDECLVTLATLQIPELGLNGTKISNQGLSKLLGNYAPVRLEFGDREFTDQDLEQLPAIPHLSLSRTKITDEGICKYVERVNPIEFDASYNSIDGSGFVTKARFPHIVNLDGTQVTTANLVALFTTLPTTRFSIRETQAKLPPIPPGSQISLKLGGGAISEQDILALGSCSMFALSIASEEFTGKCLAPGCVSTSVVDLSHSGVSDEDIRGLIGQSFSSLDLSHTNISDAALPSLAQLSVYELNLSHTKLTAKGLMNSEFTGVSRIIVSATQFTPDELALLWKLLRVKTNQRSYYQ